MGNGFVPSVLHGVKWSLSRLGRSTEKCSLLPNEWVLEWGPEPVSTVWRREKFLSPGRNQTTIPRMCFSQYSVEVYFRTSAHSLEKPANNSYALHIT